VISHALVRPPGASFAQAISSSHAMIDVALAQAQHAEYRQALAEAGVQVEILPPDEHYPDSCFMQDPAMVIAGRAIINRPGAASRRGEAEALVELLASRFPTTRIIPPGTLEGGDVLILPDRVVVGRSDRTNRAGIAQLVVALADLKSDLTGLANLSGLPGLPVLEAPVVGYLHLLSAVTHLGDGTLLAVEDFVLPPALSGFPVLRVLTAEGYACNALGIGDRVILPAGYPRTAAMLKAHGFDVLLVPTTEFAKADGGVTCLALVW
jgi:dimethylargininase